MVDFKEHILDITADDRIFTPRGVGALNIGVVQCLSELIANSLDWRRFNSDEKEAILKELEENEEARSDFIETYGHLLDLKPVQTEIKIRYDGDRVEMWDNGIGMTLGQLEVGLKLRAASDSRREPLRSRKGMFGMGMKVGILGMGWRFAIRTRPISHSVENAIEIDTRMIEAGRLSLREIKGRVYAGPDHDGPLKDMESGTYIRIDDLHKNRHNPATWEEEIGRNFSPELDYGNVKIVIVDDSTGGEPIVRECKPEVIPIIPESKKTLDDMELYARRDYGDGTHSKPIKITGWLALRRTSASGSGLWGVHTFRKGQLVEAFHNDGPRNDGLLPRDPHPTLARLHGEVHLDMCDPNFTKVGWNTGLESWAEARDALEPVLSQMLELARTYKKSEGWGARERKLMQEIKAASQESVSKISDRPNFDEEILDSRDYVQIGAGDYIRISVTQTSLPNSEAYWDYTWRRESRELAVVVNTASDLWKWASKRKDAETVAQLLINWAIVDSLYFCLVDYLGVEPNRAIMLRDQWHSKLYSEGDNNE